MDYGVVEKGIFVKRLNRFSALVERSGCTEVCHVKNTGRLGELLLPGAPVYLKFCDGAGRKTRWDLIAVESGGQIVNIDSQAPNRAFGEFATQGSFRPDVQSIRPEFTYGDSRFDFRLETASGVQFVEVKGVTLLREGCAYFPDAPTERGVKHLRGLAEATASGFEAAAVFVIQMKGARALRPNDETQPAFGEALRAAQAAGVQIFAYDCCVTASTLDIDHSVPVEL
jgi:sugar fermentation stimulation protein A